MLAEPCDAGKYLDQSLGCQTCDADTYSPANNKLAKCTDCPAGKGVLAGTGTQESDCKWSELKIGFIFSDNQLLTSQPQENGRRRRYLCISIGRVERYYTD